MIENRYPGLYRTRVPSGLWPLLAVSAALHVGLFGAFSRFHIRPAHRVDETAIQMVELAPPGGASGAGPAPAARPEPPAAPDREPAAEAPAAPPPEPPAEPEPPKAAAVPLIPPTKPRATRAPAAPAPKPVPKVPALRTAKTDPAKPKAEERGEEAVSEAVARLRAKAGAQDRIADRVARLRDKNAEPDAEALSRKIASLRERQIQGSEEQVSQRIAALRQKFGTRPPSRGSGGGPVGVSGGEGGGGLQGFLQARYIDGLREHLNLYWSVPDTLRGRDLEAFVTVLIDRRGKIVNWSVRDAGNRLFDDLVKRAVAQADPFPVVPNGLSGERFEFELRFSAP